MIKPGGKSRLPPVVIEVPVKNYRNSNYDGITQQQYVSRGWYAENTELVFAVDVML